MTGYSPSKKIIERMSPFLKMLSKAESRIFFRTKNPGRLEYQLRRAMFSAKVYDDANYRNLFDEWKLSVQPLGVRCVKAFIKNIILETSDCKTLIEIVNHLAELPLDTVDQVTYRGIDLEDEEMVKLQNLVRNLNMYLVSLLDGVMVTRNPRGKEWIPPNSQLIHQLSELSNTVQENTNSDT